MLQDRPLEFRKDVHQKIEKTLGGHRQDGQDVQKVGSGSRNHNHHEYAGGQPAHQKGSTIPVSLSGYPYRMAKVLVLLFGSSTAAGSSFQDPSAAFGDVDLLYRCYQRFGRFVEVSGDRRYVGENRLVAAYGAPRANGRFLVRIAWFLALVVGRGLRIGSTGTLDAISFSLVFKVVSTHFLFSRVHCHVNQKHVARDQYQIHPGGSKEQDPTVNGGIVSSDAGRKFGVAGLGPAIGA